MCERCEELEEALWRIQQWAEAYPPTVFGELTSADLLKAHAALKANGMTIDAISAHVGRHCLKGVGDIARGALQIGIHSR
jgi:hypothetical protein